LTDGFKTVLNVIGNSSNAILLSRWEVGAATTATELVVAPVPEAGVRH
jgi:proton glutamate symport protein